MPRPVSLLKNLRQLIPLQRIGFEEVLAVAERQAGRLRQLLGDRITENALARRIRLRIVHEPLTTSGLSYWNGQEWIIALNSADTRRRQRFALLHELKRIIDHGHRHLYQSAWEADYAADYFAGCVLVPRSELAALIGGAIDDLGQIAKRFQVSRATISLRLRQINLDDTDPLGEPVATTVPDIRPVPAEDTT
jgi:Zn-dependent peptidase ImmA (M78 family)